MKKSLADFLLGLQDWEETGMDADLCSGFVARTQKFSQWGISLKPGAPYILQIKLQIYTHIQLLFLCNSCRCNTFYLLAYLKNSVFHGVEITICFFMPNCFINLLFSKSHPWIRIQHIKYIKFFYRKVNVFSYYLAVGRKGLRL